MSHDGAVKQSKANVFVFSDSVGNLGKIGEYQQTGVSWNVRIDRITQSPMLHSTFPFLK